MHRCNNLVKDPNTAIKSRSEEKRLNENRITVLLVFHKYVTISQSVEQVILVASLNRGCKKIKYKRIPLGNFDLKKNNNNNNKI